MWSEAEKHVSARPSLLGRSQRVMVYCHDSTGIGHLRRSHAICRHLAGIFSDASFLVATGTPYISIFKQCAGIDHFKLPSLAKDRNGTYHSKYLGIGLHQLLKCRQAMLLAAVQHFRPAVLLIDKAPVGVRGEMLQALHWLERNRPRTRVIFGMRDIEDDAQTTIRQWSERGVLSVLESNFDEIWVYGVQALFDVASEYQLPDTIRSKLQYTGYIGRSSCTHPMLSRQRYPEVLVTVGGGTDGGQLLASYLSGAARRVAQAGGSSTLIGGPDLPLGAAVTLKETAEHLPNTRWIETARCMSCYLKQADVVVCMGGYNTLCEVVSLGKPALVIPRVRPRQEQAIRAERWERLGLIRSLHPDRAGPIELADSVMELVSRPVAPAREQLDLGGLKRIAERFQSIFYGAGKVAS